MEGSDAKWAWVRRQAAGFLRGYVETATGLSGEDVVQEASLAAWQWARRPHDPNRFWAAVRTIVQRQRARAHAAVRRRPWLLFTDLDDGEPQPVAPRLEDGCLTVAGRTVSLAWARARLPAVLAQLPSLDRQLLLGFHEGFCCAELAHRYGRSADCVKTRIHRARKRIRSEFEAIARAAGDLDAS